MMKSKNFHITIPTTEKMSISKRQKLYTNIPKIDTIAVNDLQLLRKEFSDQVMSSWNQDWMDKNVSYGG